jgi:hypothetical protein
VIYLLFALSCVMTVYVSAMFLVMKRVIPWRYKAFVYGSLTFLMLIAVFVSFSFYDRFWKG